MWDLVGRLGTFFLFFGVYQIVGWYGVLALIGLAMLLMALVALYGPSTKEESAVPGRSDNSG